MAFTGPADDWHEPLGPPTPKPAEEPKEEAAVEEAATVEVVCPSEEEYAEAGCCPDCGGYFSCNCGEYDDGYDYDDYGDDAGYDDGYDSEGNETEGKCPCCGFPNDPAEMVYPFCSNDCWKRRIDDYDD